jgi:hypothetical protein
VQASLVAWLTWAGPHFAFHVAQVWHFTPLDNLAQRGGLGLLVALTLILLFILAYDTKGSIENVERTVR